MSYSSGSCAVEIIRGTEFDSNDTEIAIDLVSLWHKDVELVNQQWGWQQRMLNDLSKQTDVIPSELDH